GQKDEMVFLGREIHERRDYSEKIAQQIDEEVSRFLQEAYKKAQELIKKEKARLEKVVKVLLSKETLEREEFEALMAS
ncbi:MAG: cell division protein FtsH, partial [Patescibacteria group bacterium]